ncbi:MAG: carbohydrate kinase family protein [Promethearchaeota archaeon]
MTSSPRKRGSPIVACLGEALIDFIAEETGMLNAVHSFHKYPGGAPANVAVGLARLNVATGFIGKIGSDTFGNFLIAQFEKNGVNTDGITQTSEAPTALAFVSRSARGDRDFLFYRNPCADILLKKADIPKNWLQNIRYLHVGGVSLTRQPSRDATLYAVKIAHKNGASITFDPNLRLNLWQKGIRECQTTIRELLTYTDIFLPSEEELTLLMGSKDLDKAVLRAHESGPSTVCVKRGPHGSYVSHRTPCGENQEFFQSPYPVQVVDTTGAGDGYDAGLLAGLVNQLPLQEAVLWGTAVASLVITKMGAMTALPTKAELATFLKNFEKPEG